MESDFKALSPQVLSPSPPPTHTELTGGMALDFDLWIHLVVLLTAGGGVALHVGPSGTLGLLVLGERWRKRVKSRQAQSHWCRDGFWSVLRG